MFDGENISFDASLVIYTNSTNIPSIMIIKRIYENLNLLSLSLVSFLVGLRIYQHPCRLRFKCDGTRAETRFRFSAKLIWRPPILHQKYILKNSFKNP